MTRFPASDQILHYIESQEDRQIDYEAEWKRKGIINATNDTLNVQDCLQQKAKVDRSLAVKTKI